MTRSPEARGPLGKLLDEMFATLELPIQRFDADLGSGRSAEVVDPTVSGIRMSIREASRVRKLHATAKPF